MLKNLELAFKSNGFKKHCSALVVIDPRDFLKLFPLGENVSKSESSFSFLYNSLKDGLACWTMPYVNVDANGHTYSHEGRHRASILAKMGIRKMPLQVYYKDSKGYLCEPPKNTSKRFLIRKYDYDGNIDYVTVWVKPLKHSLGGL